MDPKTLRLLVVEDDLEDEQLLCEALIEIEENRLWCTWSSASIVQVDQLADAADCLARDRFDAVLLNLSLPDSPSLLDTFLEVRFGLETASGQDGQPAGEIPIIPLLDEPDEYLANRLIREGAQDVLVKSELECAVLARSVRYAIERQRRSSASRSGWLHDTLTGTLAREGFLALVERYVQLGLNVGVHLLAGTLEVVASRSAAAPRERQAADLVMLHAGETLRGVFPEPSLLGRIEPYTFGLVTTGLDCTHVEGILRRTGGAVEAAAWAIHAPVSVRFEVREVRSAEDLQRVFSSPSAFADRGAMKTAMLAD